MNRSSQYSDTSLLDVDPALTHDAVAFVTSDKNDPSLPEPPIDYPTGLPLYMTMLAVNLRMFLSSLDQTILSPVAPAISNEFHALQDIGWYFSAYFFMQTALQPLYSRLYVVDLKWPYIMCTVIFLVGSIMCAVAKSSNVFIAGRAISGLGGAGGFFGSLTIISTSVPLHKVPVWMGIYGATYGLGALCGPLIGGSFASRNFWRGAFWINVPIGGVALVIAVIFIRPSKRVDLKSIGFKRAVYNVAREDWLGAALAVGAILSYIMAMQHAGVDKYWGSPYTIGLLAGSGGMLVAFVINEYFMGERAGIKPRIFRQRSVYAACLVSFTVSSAFYIYLSVLPIYFQLLGSSPVRSAVQLMAFVAGAIFTVLLSGAMVPKIGYVHPALLLGGVCTCVGSGLAQLLTETSSVPFWAGTSLLFGIGIGQSLNMPFLSVQSAFTGPDREAAGSCVVFAQTLGGVSVTLSQTIYINCFKQYITDLRIPALRPDILIAAGATGFRDIVPAKLLPVVAHVGVAAIRRSLIPVTVTAGIAFLATFAIPFTPLAKVRPQSGEDGVEKSQDS